MKTMLIAFAAIVAIAIGSDVILDNAGFSSADRATGAAVRLED